jgi:hypothetical protein
MAAAAALALGGCWGWSAPVGDPATPAPVTETASPLEPARLERAAEACGTADAVPRGDTSFVGEAAWDDMYLPDGMTVRVSVRVVLEAEHGDHSVDLNWTSGTVTGPDGTVVGIVTGLSTPGNGSGSGTALSSVVYVSLGSCTEADAALGEPLADGSYELVLSGLVNPVDHNHAEQEYWVANPVAFDVVDGDIEMKDAG